MERRASGAVLEHGSEEIELRSSLSFKNILTAGEVACHLGDHHLRWAVEEKSKVTISQIGKLTQPNDDVSVTK